MHLRFGEIEPPHLQTNGILSQTQNYLFSCGKGAAVKKMNILDSLDPVLISLAPVRGW